MLRSQTGIALLKYLEEGLAVVLNGIALSQIKPFAKLQLLKSFEFGTEVNICKGFAFAELKKMQIEYAQEVQ